MNRVNEEAKSREEWDKGDNKVHEKCIFWLCDSYGTDVVVEMFSDRIAIFSDPFDWGENHISTMKRIRNYVSNLKTILDCTYNYSSYNERDGKRAHLKSALLQAMEERESRNKGGK